MRTNSEWCTNAYLKNRKGNEEKRRWAILSQWILVFGCNIRVCVPLFTRWPFHLFWSRILPALKFVFLTCEKLQKVNAWTWSCWALYPFLVALKSRICVAAFKISSKHRKKDVGDTRAAALMREEAEKFALSRVLDWKPSWSQHEGMFNWDCPCLSSEWVW